MKGLFIILVLFFFTACTSSNNDNAHSVLPILDLSKEYPEKKIDICEIADVEYIPLESSEKSIIAGGVYYIYQIIIL